ncbi:uncharacterized protein TRIADDRAFT_52272 [Trichoplax adhaerens]|uniref:Rab-GAP TBC domain-containing protein n=1 Tax=Trichoplax adhaerens TaxID=10228 RepID=B3RM85_TRIAD|nr:hypothetical protein TRIADDRAFT_52272 [Trichoplax adhaerens]EDV28919.1 hypothetical protein TRIADDRAFT_52272 [Trichoplax adhaerens]|eukprot:XP_002108121.1 hypothetical protein TRIADDRAFT_52272 [Trichoplax adhaerens]
MDGNVAHCIDGEEDEGEIPECNGGIQVIVNAATACHAEGQSKSAILEDVLATGQGDRNNLNLTGWKRTAAVNDRSAQSPLTKEIWEKHIDKDGRVTNEDKIRERIFKGGINPIDRKDVWKFLFGMYLFNSTFRERQALDEERAVRYFALRARWQFELRKYNVYHQDDVNNINSDEPVFMVVQKQVKLYACRQPFDENLTLQAIRTIDKDVPRTDRVIDFYQLVFIHVKVLMLTPYLMEQSLRRGEQGDKRLESLRHILITFAAFHPGVTYAQGMNDVLSRFLVVLESEVDAFWCFNYFIERVENDFRESGMLLKIASVQRLLMVLDSKLFEYLESLNASDLMICHSGHLEPHSYEGAMAIEQQRILEIEKGGGCVHGLEVDVNSEFTFDIFVSVAVLMIFRANIMKAADATEVFSCLNNLTTGMDLNTVIEVAECLFFIYCRTTVRDSFEIIQSGKEAEE